MDKIHILFECKSLICKKKKIFHNFWEIRKIKKTKFVHRKLKKRKKNTKRVTHNWVRKIDFIIPWAWNNYILFYGNYFDIISNFYIRSVIHLLKKKLNLNSFIRLYFYSMYILGPRSTNLFFIKNLTANECVCLRIFYIAKLDTRWNFFNTTNIQINGFQ